MKLPKILNPTGIILVALWVGAVFLAVFDIFVIFVYRIVGLWMLSFLLLGEGFMVFQAVRLTKRYRRGWRMEDEFEQHP